MREPVRPASDPSAGRPAPVPRAPLSRCSPRRFAAKRCPHRRSSMAQDYRMRPDTNNPIEHAPRHLRTQGPMLALATRDRAHAPIPDPR